ncbi:MAG: hypothetical protein NVSMB9_35370 [Isosphaeraceae bacterium]
MIRPAGLIALGHSFVERPTIPSSEALYLGDRDKTMRGHYYAVFLLVAAGGCGDADNTVWVTGKLLKGGAPYFAPRGQFVDVTFVGLEIKDPTGKATPGGEPFQADLDDNDGSFSVPGKEGRGILPGKYRIVITQRMTRVAFDASNPKQGHGHARRGNHRETDMLANRYGPDTSPILREVKKNGELIIDLDRPSE